MSRDAVISRVTRVEARCEPVDWVWPAQDRERIEANWERRKAKTPKLFNGRVLMLRDLEIQGDFCRSTYFEVDYINFLGWIDLGYPDQTVANGFAMGALCGSDGGFICGIMHRHTANAGRIYFPAGTPDRADLKPGGSVDLATSLTRELLEETGLSQADYHLEDEWVIVRLWPVVALMRMVTVPAPAAEVADRIRATLAKQDPPELEDVRIIRGLEDIDPQRMPHFLQAFFRWTFAQR